MGRLVTAVLTAALLSLGCDDEDDGEGEALTTFDEELSPDEEVPPCAAAGVGAEGSATVAVSDDDSTVTVTGLTWTNLSGRATAAHLHAGAPGVAGPAVFPLPAPDPVDSAFTAADYPSPPPNGAPADFQAFVAAMRAGQTYLNVHTASCPGGEIRGQID